MSDVEDAILVSHDPKWTAPVILCTCPSCGRRAERASGAWASKTDGSLDARMGCWPLAMDDPPCYRTFDVHLGGNA